MGWDMKRFFVRKVEWEESVSFCVIFYGKGGVSRR